MQIGIKKSCDLFSTHPVKVVWHENLASHEAQARHVVALKGPSHIAALAGLLEELPEAARAMIRIMLDALGQLDQQIRDLDRDIARRAREDEVSRRLMTIPEPRNRVVPGSVQSQASVTLEVARLTNKSRTFALSNTR